MSEGAIVAIAVALIGFCGVALAAYIPVRRLRRENTEQHAANYDLLKATHEKVESIDGKVDRHLGWHQGRGDGTPVA